MASVSLWRTLVAWFGRWFGRTRALGAGAVDPAPGAGRFYIANGTTLSVIDVSSGEAGMVALEDVPARLWALRDLGFPGRLVALP